MVEPGIEPGTSWLVVRSSDHQTKRLVTPDERRTCRNAVLRLTASNSSDALVLRVAYMEVHSNIASKDIWSSVAWSSNSGAIVPLCWSPGVLRKISVDNWFDLLAFQLVTLFPKYTSKRHYRLPVYTITNLTRNVYYRCGFSTGIMQLRTGPLHLEQN